MKKENRVFEEMLRTNKAFHAARLHGEYPYSAGQVKAMRAWADSVENRANEVELTKALYRSEIKAFIETLRKAGIKTFTITDSSDRIYENIGAFVDAGCTDEGYFTVRKLEFDGIRDHYVDSHGIRFSL